MSRRKLWRFITGEKGVNRIRVYERVPGGPLQVEWYDRDGRHQRSLTTLAGTPLRGDSEYERELAKKVAERMARAQRKKRQAQVAHQLLGLPVPHTLGDLLEKYHEAHPDWSVGHTRQQNVNRDYWLDRLGGDRLLTSITPALAANIVKTDVQRTGGKGFGKRTQEKRLRYIKDAFSFAQMQLKWITEENNLSALKPPKAEGESKPYSMKEVRLLLPAAVEEDLRCGAAAYIAWISGRRANAIRTLKTSAYTTEIVGGEEVGVIQFPGATDKARRSGKGYLTGRAKEVVEALANTPAARSSGYLFPTGELDQEGKRRPISESTLRNMLHRAEARAGIEHIDGRAYHGLKRRYATEAIRLDPQAASKQSGTTIEMLRRAYEQDDPHVKVELARGLDRAVTD